MFGILAIMLTGTISASHESEMVKLLKSGAGTGFYLTCTTLGGNDLLCGSISAFLTYLLTRNDKTEVQKLEKRVQTLEETAEQVARILNK